MRRYYFHVRNRVHSLDDEVGEVHGAVEAAKAKAQQIARELAQEPETYCGYGVIVTDEGGNTIADVMIIAE